MKTKTLGIKGMHCASCVITLEKALKKVPGVKEARVNFASEKATVEAGDEVEDHALHRAVTEAGYAIVEDAPKGGHVHGVAKEDSLHWAVRISIPIVAFTIALMAYEMASRAGWVPLMGPKVEDFVHHLLPVFATYMLFAVGAPYLQGLARFVRTGRADMDALVGLGTLTAFLYSFFVSVFVEAGMFYYDVTIVVVGFITLGKYLEAKSKKKTGEAMRSLLTLQAKTAVVRRDGVEMTIGIAEVRKGDLVVVKPGQRIPVDGVVAEGVAVVDESTLTGEAIPRERAIGETVRAGTVCTTTSFVMTAVGLGDETLLSRIIALVESAQGSKAPLEKLADRVASVFVPAVLVVACITFFVWLGFGTVAQALTAFVSVLVIACPCALGLAVPTAMIVGVGRGAKRGILIKNAEALESLAKVDALVFDKTGTLTEGKAEVVAEAVFADSEHVYSTLLAIESLSDHPIAEAVVRYLEPKVGHKSKATHLVNTPGVGVTARVDGVTYFVGGSALLSSLGLTDTGRVNGAVVYLATDKNILARFVLEDTVKVGAKEAIARLKSIGMRLVLASGDRDEVAQAIATELGISEVLSSVLPDAKAEKIRALKHDGYHVAMVGDGVNDAPALAVADVSIAMATGSDISIEASDLILLNGDISKITEAFTLARSTRSLMKQNLFWAFIYNVVGIPIAAGVLYPVFGLLLSPVIAGFAMALSSISVVLNSLRLSYKR